MIYLTNHKALCLEHIYVIMYILMRVPCVKGPMRLYIGSLHFNITEEMLKGIFEPFGKIQQLQLIMDTETGRSKGYGFVTVRIFKGSPNFQ